MIGLLVFFAVALPIGIHLLSHSEGKVIPFSNVILLPRQTLSTELRVKLLQKYLLLVRILLVVCASALVSANLLSDLWSQSEWRKLLSSESSEPTVIVTQDWWITSSEQEKSALKNQLSSGSLQRVNKLVLVTTNKNEGRSVKHVLRSDFLEHANEYSMFNIAHYRSTDEGYRDHEDNALQSPLDNIWSIAQAIAHNIPADSSLHIFTSNRLAQFYGGQTRVREPVVWHISNIVEGTYKSMLTVAIVDVNKVNASPKQLQKMAQTKQALEFLKLVYSNIDVTIISNDNANLLSTLISQYDALIIGENINNEGINSQNLIQLKALPLSSKSSYVIELGKAIFRTRQQEYFVQNNWLSAKQIEEGAKMPAPQLMSNLPKSTNNRWQKLLALLLLVLFAIERFMSEQNSQVEKVDAMKAREQ